MDKTPKTLFEKALPDEYSSMLSIKRPPKILAAYFMDHGGVLITSVEREEGSLDADIFSGMLSAVNNFVKDSMDQMTGNVSSGALGAMTYDDEELGEVTIQMSRGDRGVMAVTYIGEVSEGLKKELARLNAEVHRNHSEMLVDWDGDVGSELIISIRTSMKNLFFDSKKYEGIIEIGKLKATRENIKEKMLKKLKLEFSKNRFAFVFDDVQEMDDFSVEMTRYFVRNSSIPMICQYETEVLESVPDVVCNIIEGMDKGKISMVVIKSDVDIESLAEDKFVTLDKIVMDMLKYASVLGEFDVEIISDASGIALESVRKGAEILEQIGIIAKRRFANSRLKERAYETITYEDRSNLELSMVRALESRGDEYVPMIAELSLKNKDEMKDKAIQYSLEAAEQFLRALDLQGSLYFYHEAIDLDEDVQRKIKTLKEILEIERSTWISHGLYEQYRADIATLEELAQISGDDDAIAIAKLYRLRLLKDNESSGLGDAVDRLLELEKLAQKLDDIELLISAYNFIGIIHRKKGLLDKALVYFKKALYLAGENEVISHRYKIQNNMGLCLMAKGEWEHAERLFASSLDIARKLNYVYSLPSLMSNLVYLYSEKGKASDDPETRDEIKHKIIDLKDESMEICEETGELKNELSILLSTAELIMKYPEELHHAKDLFNSAWIISEKLGYDTTKALVLLNLSELNLLEYRSNVETLERLLEEGTIDEEFIDLLKERIGISRSVIDIIEEKFFM